MLASSWEGEIDFAGELRARGDGNGAGGREIRTDQERNGERESTVRAHLDF